MGNVLECEDQTSMFNVQLDKIYDEIQIPRKKNDFCEITVPHENGLYWAVGLAYLSHVNPEEENFVSNHRRLITMAKDTMEKYNFFENRYEFFNDLPRNSGLFRKLFSTLVHSNLENNQEIPDSVYNNQLHSSQDSHLVLQFSSDALVCQINLIEIHSQDEEKTYCFRPKTEEPRLEITVIKSIDENKEIFSFKLDETLAKKSQKAAIRKVFEIVNKKLAEELADFTKLETPDTEIGENLLIKLLRTRSYDFLKELYHQPPYVFQKLLDAAVEVDPLTAVEEDGKTAFCYVVESDDFNVISLFYDFALRCPNWLLTSSREETPELKNNLDRLSKILQKTKEYFLSQMQQNSKFLDLQKIHNFQEELFKRFKSLSSPSASNKELEEARKIKNKILILLEFYLDLLETECRNDSEENNVDFIFYLDKNIALHFFDNSFSLKQTFGINKPEHEKIESEFCRLEFVKQNTLLKEKFPNDYIVMVDAMRKQLRDKLKVYIHYLKSLPEKRLNNSRQNQFDTLRSQPEIKDEFNIWNLRTYINLATEAIGVESDELYIPLLFRLLQVLGESVNLTPKTEHSIIKTMLVSLFSSNTNQLLKTIRNLLSHPYKDRNVIRDKKWLTDTGKEIEKIKECIEPIIKVQEYQTSQWMIQTIVELIRDSSELMNNEALKSSCNKLRASNKKEFMNSDFFTLKKYVTHLQNFQEQIKSRCEIDENESDLTGICEFINSQFVRYKKFLCFILSENMFGDDELKNSICKGVFDNLCSESDECNEDSCLSIKNHTLDRLKSINYLEEEAKQAIIDERLRNEMLSKSADNIDTLKIHDAEVENARQVESSQQTNFHIDESGVEIFPSIAKLSILLQDTSSQPGKISVSERALEPFKDNATKLRNIIEAKVYKNIRVEYKKDFKKSAMKEKILQHFMCDEATKTAVEMLMLNCMNTVMDQTEWKNICPKISKLFQRLNVRNVFLHENPLVSAVTSLFDPNDLSNEIVRIVLIILEDLDAVSRIDNIMMENGMTCNKFVSCIEANYSRQSITQYGQSLKRSITEDDLRVIKKCDRWKDYANLAGTTYQDMKMRLRYQREKSH